MHLLDANVFIESKNVYYDFETFPGFWDWLDAEQMYGNLGSIQSIYDELVGGNDDLADWAKDRKKLGWFIQNDDIETQRIFRQIASWVIDYDFRGIAKSEFLYGGDPWLIAKAKAIGATVVTQETFEPQSKRKVKIPNVCREFGVPCINIFELLRQNGAVFTFGGTSMAADLKYYPTVKESDVSWLEGRYEPQS